jgi:hypothetical protein
MPSDLGFHLGQKGFVGIVSVVLVQCVYAVSSLTIIYTTVKSLPN